MRNSSLKKRLFYIVAATAFLSFLPFSICKAAYKNSEEQSSNWYTQEKIIHYTFDKGTTVGMLQKELDSQPRVLKVAVLKPDGSKRSQGLLEDDDFVETLNDDGDILSTVIAVIKQDGGSSTSAVYSSGASSGEETSSGGVTSLPADGGDYMLSAGTTVKELSEKISSMSGYGDYGIEVKGYDGKKKQDGLACTGDTVKMMSGNGKEAGTATVIVRGDLTRCGAVTDGGCDILYCYLSQNKKLAEDILRAADMNGDGIVDTSDLLLMKRAH